MQTRVQRIEDLVEELRASGYHGREPGIANAPPHMGTRVTAARQLETVASQIASAWLDGDMDDRELWQFIHNSFIDKIAVLADIIGSTLPPTDAGAPRPWNAADWNLFCYDAWRGATRLITWAKTIPSEALRCEEWVVALLIVAMVLRQCGEHCVTPNQAGPMFQGRSSNIAPEFFDRCVAAVGRCPFADVKGVELSELALRIEVSTDVEQSLFTSSRRANERTA